MTTNLEVKESLVTLAPQSVRLLLAHALLELVEKGWSEPGGWFLLEHGHRAAWLEEDGVPLAVATLQTEEEYGTLWVPLIYVAPGRRRQGLFKYLMQRIRYGARNQRLASVQLGTHSGNAPMRAAVEAIGMRPTFVRYTVPAMTGEEAQSLVSMPSRELGEKR